MTGASFAGRPGFAGLKAPPRPAARPTPKPFPGHAEYRREAHDRRRAVELVQLEECIRVICQRRGFEFCGASPCAHSLATRFTWRTPNGRVHHVDVPVERFASLPRVAEAIVEAIDATVPTAHDRAGVVDGEGTIL